MGLVGFCFDHNEQILVYEYIPNGSLRDSLSGTFLPSSSLHEQADTDGSLCSDLRFATANVQGNLEFTWIGRRDYE